MPATFLRALGTLKTFLGDFGWPVDKFPVGDLDAFLNAVFVLDYAVTRRPDVTSYAITLATKGEVKIRVPGLLGSELVLGGAPPAGLGDEAPPGGGSEPPDADVPEPLPGVTFVLARLDVAPRWNWCCRRCGWRCGCARSSTGLA